MPLTFEEDSPSWNRKKFASVDSSGSISKWLIQKNLVKNIESAVRLYTVATILFIILTIFFIIQIFNNQVDYSYSGPDIEKPKTGSYQ